MDMLFRFSAPLTHWGRVTQICVSKLAITGSDNGLSPGRRQAIIWTIAGILLIGPMGTNFSEILIGIQTFSFKKMHFKMASAKWRPSCLALTITLQGLDKTDNSNLPALSPREYGFDCKFVIFQMRAFRWMTQIPTDDKSTLVQITDSMLTKVHDTILCH